MRAEFGAVEVFSSKSECVSKRVVGLLLFADFVESYVLVHHVVSCGDDVASCFLASDGEVFAFFPVMSSEMNGWARRAVYIGV